MEIYREEDADLFSAFLASDAEQPGKRRSILTVPPLYTMQKEYLLKMLERRSLDPAAKDRILQHAEAERTRIEKILSGAAVVEDEISVFMEEEFALTPPRLPLVFDFIDEEIIYSREEYLAHLTQTRDFAKDHAAYRVTETNTRGFCNLQITMLEGKWAMVSKNNAPAIHFVIRHPKLRAAIEKYIPPLADRDGDKLL
ncbi:MAG: hypothetical protein ACOX4I_08610 [Anaerovoracaceae bacterium]|jgi:hypothetical protein